MKYILELLMESEDQPTQEEFVSAVKAAEKELPGSCISWGLRGISTKSGKSVFDNNV